MIPDRPSSPSPVQFALRCALHLLLGAALAGAVATLCLLCAVRAHDRTLGRIVFQPCMFAAGAVLCITERLRQRAERRAACTLCALGGLILTDCVIYAKFFL